VRERDRANEWRVGRMEGGGWLKGERACVCVCVCVCIKDRKRDYIECRMLKER